MAEPFALAPGIDVAALAAEFRARRRIRIAPFLTDDSADALIEHIRARDDWRLVVNAGDKVFEIDRAGQRGMSKDQWAQLDQLVKDQAEDGFQFRFETIRVPDSPAEREARASLLDRFASFLSSARMIELFREITGSAAIDFADAQATSYSAGHFLTAHDDAVDGKGRHAAYVLGLTRNWQPEWGGALRFHETGQASAEEITPGCNVLTLFAVPQLHSVRAVAELAPKPRYSVTGWLRSSA